VGADRNQQSEQKSPSEPLVLPVPCSSPPKRNDIVKFNIGGKKFMTTMDTLASHGSNFLTLLVENDRKGIIPAMVDEKGFYFVDRNGEVFGVILDYLRTRKLFIPKHLSMFQIELEFDFYQIQRTTLQPQISKFRHVIDETVDKVSIEVREWLTTNLKAIEKFLLEQCENGLAKASLVAYFHKSSHQYETRVSDDDTINWPITSMGRSNNIWLDIVCHIISREWGIFATWTSFDSSSFQIDFHLTSTALSDPREINSPVYALLKSWERSYSRGPGLYVYKSWY